MVRTVVPNDASNEPGVAADPRVDVEAPRRSAMARWDSRLDQVDGFGRRVGNRVAGFGQRCASHYSGRDQNAVGARLFRRVGVIGDIAHHHDIGRVRTELPQVAGQMTRLGIPRGAFTQAVDTTEPGL